MANASHQSEFSENEVSDANDNEIEVSQAYVSDIEINSLGSDNNMPLLSSSSDVSIDVNYDNISDSTSFINEDLEIGSLSEEEHHIDHALNEQLKNWALKNKCTRQCVNEILEIFRQLDFDVPKDCRTLLSTKRDVNQVSIGLGHYVYLGVEKSINKLLDYPNDLDSIDLMINIDGLPLFKSSSLSLWPILIQFGPFQPM